MSLYSIIGVVLLAVILVVGTILKSRISSFRKKLDGFHGYVREKEKADENEDETGDGSISGWEIL